MDERGLNSVAIVHSATDFSGRIKQHLEVALQAKNTLPYLCNSADFFVLENHSLRYCVQLHIPFERNVVDRSDGVLCDEKRKC